MVRAFVLYEEEPEQERYERHAELCRQVPGGTFRHDEWEVLLECCQARITLPGESTATLTTLGASRLQSLSLAALLQRQLLSAEGVTK